MPIASLFESYIRQTITNDQGPWKQFVLDHLDYIAANSRTYTLAADLMHRYRYDLVLFLKEHMNRHENMAWIVLLLNNLENDFKFVDLTDLIIPDDSLLTKLYSLYRTTSQENN